MYWKSWIGVLSIVAMGCTYVSPNQVQEKILTLDEDGDGVTKGEDDCDDYDANETPGSPEIPYDGYDNDCGGDGDLVDIDGDGFPGILKADWEALDPKQPWPDDVVGDVLDCLDDPAILATANDVHPDADEVWYDGIDSNCAGDNDFDQDQDGYILDDYIDDLAEYEKTWGYSFPDAQAGDCDDSQDRGVDAFPNNPAEDIPYDGKDTNCDGSNDFDADNDGFSPSEYSSSYDVYVNYYGYPSNFVGGDCVDQPMALTGDAADGSACAYEDGGVWMVEPSCVYPDATDETYDGIDADCEGDNDFDLDIDGFMPNGTEQAYADYIVDWGLSLDDGAFNDCDDADETRNPNALEMLNDDVDQDCDAEGSLDGTDTSPFDFGNLSYISPGHVVVTSNAYHYLISTLAVEVTDTTTPIPTTWSNTGVTLRFEFDATKNTEPVDIRYQNDTEKNMGTGFDVVVPDDESFLSMHTELWSVGLNNEMTAFMNAFMYTWDLVSTYDQIPTLNNAGGINAHYEGLDLQVDDNGDVWAVACNLDGVTFIKNPNPSQFTFDEQASITSSSGFSGSDPPQFGTDCFLDFPAADTARGTLCDGDNGCNSFLFDPVSEDAYEAPSQPFASMSVTSARTEDDLRLLTMTSGGVQLTDTSSGTDQWLLLDDHTVIDADAAWRDGVLYLAAIVEDGSDREVIMASGDPDGTLNEVTYPYASNLVAQSVGITTGDDRLVLAVSGLANDGSSDALGWILLGWN